SKAASKAASNYKGLQRQYEKEKFYDYAEYDRSNIKTTSSTTVSAPSVPVEHLPWEGGTKDKDITDPAKGESSSGAKGKGFSSAREGGLLERSKKGGAGAPSPRKAKSLYK
ncbi:unnamed protein product, partial [Amoebophrya sp. A25]